MPTTLDATAAPTSDLYRRRAERIEATLRAAGKPCDLAVSWSSDAAQLRRACAARGIAMQRSDAWLGGVDFYRFVLLGE